MSRRVATEALTQTTGQKVRYIKHNQDEATVGGRDGKVEHKI